MSTLAVYVAEVVQPAIDDKQIEYIEVLTHKKGSKAMAISSFVQVALDNFIENHSEQEKREPQVGDHLIAQRTGYTHHGIYLGNGEVIHYSGFHDGFNSGPVIKTSFSEFANKSHVMINDLLERKYSAAESVARAKSKLGETEYNLISNNCEHFVNWCIHGKASSKQVKEACLILCSPVLVKSIQHAKLASTLLSTGGSSMVNRSAGMMASHLSRSATPAIASNISGITSGVITSGLTSSAFAGGVTSSAVLVAGGISTPLVVSVAAGVAIGYGVKKAWDWIVD